jgi:hypothetical protein
MRSTFGTPACQYCSFRATVRRSPGTALTNLNGPVPTGCPAFCDSGSDITVQPWLMKPGMTPSGDVVKMSIV